MSEYKCALEPGIFKINGLTAWVGSVSFGDNDVYGNYRILIQKEGRLSGYDYRMVSLVPNCLVNTHNGFNPSYAAYLFLKYKKVVNRN